MWQQLAGACLVHCTLFCITHTCLLGHLSPAFNLLLHRYTLTLGTFSTWKCAKFNFVQKSGKRARHDKIVQRQAEFGECQILARVPTALVDAPQAHTRSSIIYSHVWMWGGTSSWAPRGDLRHFSREEEEEEASRRACHLSIAHVRQYTPAASRQTDEADDGDA